MRKFGTIALIWLHQVAFAVWFGGLAALGAIGAPAVFRTAKNMGDREWGTPLYNFAGDAVGEIFRRFNYVALAAGIIVLVAGLGYGLLAGMGPKRLTVRALLTAAGIGITAWLTFGLYPEMLALRAQEEMTRFDRLHQTYGLGFRIEAFLLLAIAALTAWLHLDQTGKDKGVG